MTKLQLKYRIVNKEVKPMIIPTYGTPGSACLDFCATEDISFLKTAVIPTNLAFEIPPGYVMLIFSRSSHGFKQGIRLSNCVGVIDSDYRGEVSIKLISDNYISGTSPFILIKKGDKVAQFLLVQIPKLELIETDHLSETIRGEGGFGSTGN